MSTATRIPSKKNKVTGLPSDPEARWGVAHSVRSKDKDGKVFYFGYKVHMVADSTHGHTHQLQGDCR